MSRIGTRKIAVALAVVLSLFIVWLAISATAIGIASPVGNGGLPLLVGDLSVVPQSVADDANRLATELFGDSQEEYDDFLNQLLVTYLEAEGKDFVLVFNPGGWGWNLVETSPGWWSIFTGIEAELNSSGYTSLLLNYRRTVGTLQGCIDEVGEMINGYSSKAEELACRVEFLTSHIPGLKVIMAGESLGTVISDRTMNILAHNQQVYSIQTGPPFWHATNVQHRTLVIRHNGMVPDSFSHGDFLAMVRANVKALLGLSRTEAESGTVLRYVGAPGHDYFWQYPEVYSQITNFLRETFGINW